MIRKLKILISCKERSLKACDIKSRDRIRGELARLRVTLLIAQQNRLDKAAA